MKYGLIPEFVGRVPVAVTLDLLDEDALVRILTEPRSAICKQYKKLFELDGVELEIEDDALREIAKEAMERKTGARGLRAIMENATLNLMYEIPSNPAINKCVITKDVITGNGEPILPTEKVQIRMMMDHPRSLRERKRQIQIMEKVLRQTFTDRALLHGESV